MPARELTGTRLRHNKKLTHGNEHYGRRVRAREGPRGDRVAGAGKAREVVGLGPERGVPVCATRDPRLFAAVPLWNENHTILNG